jgi:phosphoribosylamine---glycine ligase
METKNFLFVSLGGLIGDIAWQVQKEGHAAETTVWRSDVGWADVIVFDDTLGQGARADELRQQGKRVVGGTAYTDRLEDDPSFGQEELRKAGVNILPYREFEDFDTAIEYVRANSRYVLSDRRRRPVGRGSRQVAVVGVFTPIAR